jgi:hypothetical protein
MRPSGESVKLLKRLAEVDYIEAPSWPLDLDRALRDNLVDNGYISKSYFVLPGMEREAYGDHGLICYQLSGAGKDLLLLIEEEAEQAAKSKEEEKLKRRSDRRFQLTLALFTFVLGVLAERWIGIVGFVKGIIDPWFK